jgi:uncharacterized protein YuzE
MTDATLPGWTLTVDHDADAAYLQLTEEPIVRTQSFGLVNIDLDANDQAVGIELLTIHPGARRVG